MCRTCPPIYRCPRCSLRTCSLGCVVKHKEEAGCSGLRDRTAFVAKGNFSQLDLLSDYRLLEDVNRRVENLSRRDEEETGVKRKGHHYLPEEMMRLQTACRRGGRACRLLFMPRDFERRRENTSRFDGETGLVRWRLRLVFPHCRRTVVMEEVAEDQRVHRILDKFVAPNQSPGEKNAGAVQKKCSFIMLTLKTFT